MFICALTHQCSLPGEPMIRLVTRTRPVTYTNLVEDEEGKRVQKVTKGEEVVEEVGVTKEGLALWNRLHPSIQ